MRTAQSIRRWPSTGALIAPVVVALVVTVLAVAAFIIWSTRDIDALALSRQTSIVSQIFASKLQEIGHDQESVTIWDDTIISSKLHSDRKWVNDNLGRWMFDYFGHDQVIILDEQDQPVYMMNGGAASSIALFDGERSTVAPLVAQLRSKLKDGWGAPYQGSGNPNAVPRIADLTLLNGYPAIVGVMPIVSRSRGIGKADTPFLHVSVIFLTNRFALTLGQKYMLEGAGFSGAALNSSDHAFYPLFNAEGRFVTFFEWKPTRPGGRILNNMVPAIAAGGLVAGLLIFLLLDRLWRSSTALESGRRQAEHQASHDMLTGLPNRSLFDNELKNALATRQAGQGSVALLMLDLDRFKQVNDTLGHQAGDDLIRQVGQRLEGTIAGAGRIARLGGDEFAVISSNLASADAAMALSQRIIDALAQPFSIFGSEAFVGVSIGIVLAPDGQVDASELTRKADIALYEAKAGGRNRAIIYEEVMDELVQGRHTIEAELREALRRTDQISVMFQPLYGRNTGEVVGAEALARWTHPKFGNVSPTEFIPVAEGAGLIEILGDMVMRRACELGARWPGHTIAVNISPPQLRNPKFFGRVFDLLAATGMRPCDLELEITEGILLEDERVTSEALRRFRAAGIRIALDDFGTGYSSLGYLKQYAVDKIKIDRAFVSQLADDSVSVAIVQAMISLAHAMRIEVTAEGVETREQMSVLLDMGCNTFQGYLLSAPVAAAALEAIFEARGEERLAG
ncbi:MAG: hypothetical protein JWN11_2403 [Hyphomicrobiales bacterium]|nr:hypothetical protein [Hyphomicrobiales bacterium]